MGLLKNFILRSDVFASQPILRYSGEPAYETICGGCLSIIIMLAFIAIFAGSFINVLTKVNIESSSETEISHFDTNEISDMLFAVGIHGVDFSENLKYFEVLIYQRQTINGTITDSAISLEVCNKDDWAAYGQHVGQLFDLYEIDKMLCPSSGSDLTLLGYPDSSESKKIEIHIEQCLNNSANWVCHPPVDISSFMSNQIAADDYFQTEILWLDTLINAHAEQYKSHTIESEIQFPFSTSIGSRGIIKIGQYTITTDESVLPFVIETEQTGSFFGSYLQSTISLASTHYVKIEVQKSKQIITINRTHGKLDDMLSYAGGLFALLFSFLIFFLGSYAQYRYQIAISNRLFSQNKEKRVIRQKDFGFLTYVQYAIYDWLKTCCNIQWEKMQQIDEVREEASKQLDVRFLLKRIQNLQRINGLLLKQNQLVCSKLMKTQSLERVEKMRRITQFSDKLIFDQQKEESGMKVADSTQELEYHSDFDSEDQKIEKQIQQRFQEVEQDANEISQKIFLGIPQKLKSHFQKRKKPNLTITNFMMKGTESINEFA